MNKIVMSLAVASAFFIVGCSQKAPEVVTSSNVAPVKSVEVVSKDTMNQTEDINTIISRVQNQVQNVYFDFDKFDIRSDMYDVIKNNANLFMQNGVDGLNIKIEGNCDEWGYEEYNYALGLKRAKAAKEALIRQGVDADRISIVSNGESNLVCTEKTKSCDAQNRRDEFRILP